MDKVQMSPEKKIQAARHLKRCSAVPGFQRKFNALFLERSAKHPLGTVDIEVVSQEILTLLSVVDPA